MSLLDKVILGINDSHDAAAAVVHGGKILCAIAEERLQRVKGAGGFPQGAIETCLRYAGLSWEDIDYVAVAGKRAVPVNMLGVASTLSIEDLIHLQETVRRPYYYEDRDVPFAAAFPKYQPKNNPHYPMDRLPLKETREMSNEERKNASDFRLRFIAERCGVKAEQVIALDHHRCHAYYTYYASPYREEKVATLTLDAGGDGLYDTVNLFDERGKMTRLHASHECIIGPLYSQVTLLLGMRPNEHEYKVMGLAPYAKERTKARAREILIGFLELDGIKFNRNPAIKDLYFHTKEVLRHERFDGIAGGIQDFAEHFLTRWVKAALVATGARKVAYGGGVAGNVKANQLIARLEGLDGLFVPPAPGDESLAIGAAWALMDKLSPEGEHRSAIEPLSDAYLGPDFGDPEIEKFRDHSAVRERFENVPGDAIDLACEALAANEIVAVCHGRMEFGPRALGHRSILANPKSREAVTQINDAVKGRDFWMPFAPSILAENLADYICNDGRADHSFMTSCADSTDLGRRDLVAALHPYDNTLRPQSVHRNGSAHYHELLSRFKDRTGIGGVLNTSLNRHGKPLVMNPVEIADELLTAPEVRLDNLMVGQHFFRRRA